MSRRFVFAVLFGFLLFSPGLYSFAQSSPTQVAPASPSDPEAKQVLEKMATTYQGLHSFSCVEELENGISPKRILLIRFKKPNKATVTVSDKTGIISQTVCDGKHLVLFLPTSKKYLVLPLRSGDGAISTVLALGSPGSLLTAFITMPGLVSLVTDSSLSILNSGLSDTAEIVRPQTVVVVAKDDVAHVTSTFTIGRNDHLLHSLTFVDSSTNVLRTRETCSDVQANPDLPDSMFTFVPPKGMRCVELRKQLPAPKK